MKRWLALVLIIILCGSMALAKKKAEEEKKPAPAATYTGPKKRIAVTDMEVKITTTATTEPTTTGGVISQYSVNIPPPVDFGQGLTEMLTTALVESKHYIVLERKALSDVQSEQTLGSSGAVDAASAPQTGKLLGAQVLLRGSVTEYTYRKSTTGGNVSILEGVNLAKTKAEAMVALDIRMIDATTGQVIDSIRAEGKAKGSAAGLDVERDEFKMSMAGFEQSPLGEATRQAIEKAVKGIIVRTETIPWEGRVAEIDAQEDGTVNTIYINAGSDTGLKAGDELELFRPGRAIVDPETKLVIGRTRDTNLGKCRVESVTAKLAIALPVEGCVVQKEDLVRFVTPPPASPKPTETTKK